MKEFTQFENHAVEIWRRPRQRNMHLRVRPDGTLRVTCNKGISKREIEGFIRDSETFIKGCLQKISDQKTKFPAKNFTSGERHLYMGVHLPLQIIWSWSPRIRIKILPGQIEMTAPLVSTAGDRREAWLKFVRKEARAMLQLKAEVFAKKMDLYPRSLSIRGQRTRWGSCSSQGRINLNWKLLAAPVEIIDYVVIHELAHLRHMNHSPQFWELVGAFYPDYSAAKRWLRSYEPEIAVQFKSPDL